MLGICRTIASSRHKLHKCRIIQYTATICGLCDTMKCSDMINVVEFMNVFLKDCQHFCGTRLRSNFLIETDSQAPTMEKARCRIEV